MLDSLKKGDVWALRAWKYIMHKDSFVKINGLLIEFEFCTQTSEE